MCCICITCTYIELFIKKIVSKMGILVSLVFISLLEYSLITMCICIAVVLFTMRPGDNWNIMHTHVYIIIVVCQVSGIWISFYLLVLISL